VLACDVDRTELDDFLDLIIRAFGTQPPDRVADIRANAVRRIADGRCLGVRDGGRLIAAASIIPMSQWWHGRSVPLAGISSVVVAPEDRGRSAGPLLMTAVLGRAAGRGMPLSMLHPVTAPPYRKVGYELAATTYWYTLPIQALRPLAPPGGAPVKLRRAGEADAADVIAVLDRVHAAAANAATWRLTISDGTAHAERAAATADAPRLTAGGLAALYAGTPTTTLRPAGLLTGPAGADAALDAAFACRPFALDSF